MRSKLDPNRTTMLSIQVLPLSDEPIPIIDRAIETIACSGLAYRVQPMETLLEGCLDELFKVAKSAHLSCFEAGAEQVVTVIKIADRIDGVSSDMLLEKYRGEGE